MKTLKKACTPRANIFDPTRRDTVLDLGDLTDGRIDPAEFFAENHITEGMRTLLTEAFRRLEGKSTQGVFKLTQAMGGGKTHNLLALGLLAQHPDHRAPVMGDFYTPGDIGPVRDRRLLRSGERRAPRGLGRHRGPARKEGAVQGLLHAAGRSRSDRVGEPAPRVNRSSSCSTSCRRISSTQSSKSIGNSDLSVVTATALSNLLVAVGRDELRNVCLVITDLTASYAAGSQQIINALQDLEARDRAHCDEPRARTHEHGRVLSHPAEADLRERCPMRQEIQRRWHRATQKRCEKPSRWM